MREEVYDEGHLRKYLLGELNDEQQQALEERLLSDNELFDLLLVAEDELVDDYLGGTLSTGERSRFDSFFLSTPERRRKLSFAMALRKYVTAEAAVPVETPVPKLAPRVIGRPSTWSKQAFSTPYLRLAAAAVIVLGLGLGIWRVFFYRSEVAKGTAALATAYRNERPVEARISGLGYAPFPVTRGSEPQKVDLLSLHSAERTLFDEAAEHPNAEAHHALGRLYLAERQFDDAIKEFDEALKTEPANARLHGDYGALLMEIGKKEESGKRLETLARSLEHLSKALELDGSNLEALFNHALCRQHMLLFREAEEDWKTYLEKDSSSKWAEEARRRLKELEERPQQTSQNREQVFQNFLDAYQAKDDARAWKILSQNRDQTGSLIENRLIDAYLDLADKGRNNEATERLGALSYASDVERRQAADSFMFDLVRFYERATSSQRNGILKARCVMKSGNETFSKSDFDAALESYKSAKEIFVRAGDTCEAMYMDYFIGGCYVQQSKAKSGLSFFQPLARDSDRAHYRWLLVQTLIAISGADQYLRDFSAAISSTSRSLDLSEEMGDPVSVAKTRYQLGEIYRFLNNGWKALDLYARDLALAQTFFPQPGQLWRSYFSLSRVFDQLELRAAAIDFQKEALKLAIEADAPRLMCRSHNYLGLMLAKRGDYTQAATCIERAIDIGNSFPERSVQLEATAYSFLQLGYVYREAGNFDKAIENYDRAIQYYDELNSKFFSFTARKDKLLCCVEQSGCPAVKQEMETMLDLFEDQRTKILEESNRNTFFDGEQSIYDVAIEFEYCKEGNATKAFEYSERSRGRSLGDLVSTSVKIVDSPDSPDLEFDHVFQPMRFDEIRTRMPDKSQILQYAVLKNSILIWVVSKNGLSAEQRSISVEDLNRKVNYFLQLISSNSENDLERFSREAIYLYDLLIKPVENKIDSSKVVCIVPDKILNYLPFGALISRGSGSQNSEKYFVEQQDFVLSPSSNLFIRCSDFACEKESMGSETLTSVGNPSFDHHAFSHFPDLPSAAWEAKAITSYYGSPSPLTGASATKKRVLSEMEKSEVIHLATHAITDEWNPMRSKLLLATERPGAAGEDSGVLQASEIYKLNLQRVKLVVLSACRTAIEKFYGGEGMIGLSRPFIAKRIPLVVASLWPVNSEAAARLMTSFHRLRKTGEKLTTARALCSAQREMLRSSDIEDRLPRNWASFITIGGYANF